MEPVKTSIMICLNRDGEHMKVIKKANDFTRMVLSDQTEQSGVEYQQSRYVIRDGNILYNCLTAEAVLVENEEEERSALIGKWFLVPPDLDVPSLARRIRQRRILSTSGPGGNLKSGYVIFTTTGCNASCSYCFEKGQPAISMSEEEAESVGEYIIRTKANNTNQLSLKWFGGEPLLNKKAIHIICEILNKNGVAFSSIISTNGDLLPDCTDEELIGWNINAIQVTVDSIGTEYDMIKGLPLGAYERLKQSIKRLEGLGIRVNVRIHYDPSKETDICYELIDEFKDFENTKIYPRIIYGKESEEAFRELLKIEGHIMDLGKFNFDVPAYNPANHCMADNARAACIAPDGGLSVCEHYAFGENIYGSIHQRQKDMSVLEKWSVLQRDVNQGCTDCVLYPMCRKLVMCPAESRCSDGFAFYEIETIKRALRRRASEI